jgi:photosystem II stability/assembly factor-like uncharacterized protein
MQKKLKKKIKKSFIFIFVFFFSQNLFSQSYENIVWKELGPFNLWAKQGRINFIAFDPENDSIIYAGAPTGTIWQTNNGGKNWFTNSDFSIVTGVSVIAVDPENPDIIYIGTGDKSGQTYGKEGTGIYKSIDKGKTWTNINKKVKFTNIYHILINPENTNQIFVNSSFGFYKSDNAGTTWIKVYSTMFRDVKFKPGDSNIIYAVTESDFVTYSLKDNKYEEIKLEETGSCRLAVSNAEPDYVYLIISGIGLFKSENKGQKFEKISECNFEGFFQLSSYCFCFIADNENTDILYLGTRTLWRSLDGGLTWEKKSSLHPDNHFLGFSNSGDLFCGNDGGICYSTDSANTWINLNNNLSITQVYDISCSTDGNTIIAGTQDNGASICEIDPLNYKISWKNIILADVMRCQIDYSDKNNIFFSNYYPGGLSKLRRTTDVGKTNNIIANVGNKGIDSDEYFHSRIMFMLDNQNPEIIYLGARNLYKSTNAKGELQEITWKKISDFEGNYSISNIAQSFTDFDFAYLTRGLSFLFYTENFTKDSVNWTKINPPVKDINSQIKSIAIHQANDEILYIIQDNKVWKSMDRGKIWIDFSFNLKNINLNSIVIDIQQEEDLYLATSEGVYYKNLLMDGWEKISSQMPDYWITDLEITYPNVSEFEEYNILNFGKIRVATYGRGVWETNLVKQTNNLAITLCSDLEKEDSVKQEIVKKTTEEFDFILNEKKNVKSIYENNLFNYIYKKSYSVQSTENTIKISFNFLNKKVITIFDETGFPVYIYSTENQYIEISTKNFAKGMYFLNIDTDDKFNLYQLEIN